MARLKDFFQRRSREEVVEIMETNDRIEKTIAVIVLSGFVFALAVEALLKFLLW